MSKIQDEDFVRTRMFESSLKTIKCYGMCVPKEFHFFTFSFTDCTLKKSDIQKYSKLFKNIPKKKFFSQNFKIFDSAGK